MLVDNMVPINPPHKAFEVTADGQLALVAAIVGKPKRGVIRVTSLFLTCFGSAKICFRSGVDGTVIWCGDTVRFAMDSRELDGVPGLALGLNKSGHMATAVGEALVMDVAGLSLGGGVSGHLTYDEAA